ncbi:MAG: alkaline phosphatase family protein [Planctomycetes bacterium]|nr:alkaline phosphatase family protein [Planctomycetota bacterium]MBL7007382.1 alkaline phosphatase family protein [Planctomycetota bacterium]
MHLSRSPFLILLVLLGALAGPLSAASGPAGNPTQEPAGRVIVLGMDGMDAAMAEEFMDRGLLPNFSKLRQQGTFAELMPGNPAQSPVSWATLNTGKNPGKHGIFDFVRVSLDRNGEPTPGNGFQSSAKVPVEETGLALAGKSMPYLFMGGGLAAGIVLFLLLRKKMPVAILGLVLPLGAGLFLGLDLQKAFPPDGFPDYQSLIQAEEWWHELDRGGVAFRGQGTIVSYPAKELQSGKLVAGLGAPDAKGSLNSWALYSTAAERPRLHRTFSPEKDPGDGVMSSRYYLRLAADGPGRYAAKLYGPRNETLYQRLAQEQRELSQSKGSAPEVKAQLDDYDLVNTWLPLTVEWQKGAAEAVVAVDGQSQTVALGSWSDWYRLRFPWNRWLSTRANARIWVESVDDGELELYLAPLQIAPEEPVPGTRICWPPQFAGELAGRIGDFETLGWACQTHAVKDTELTDLAFIEDIEFTYEWRRKMLEDALDSDDWRVLFHFFGSPDRVCHMLMRHIDPLHPQFDEGRADTVYDFFGEPVAARDMDEAIYRRMDQAVGLTLAKMRPDDTLLIVSDHGFDSFRREVNLNNWLAQEGYLQIANRSSLGIALSTEQFKGTKKTYLNFVDWNETQAYSIALGKIYLSRQGREKNGQVAEADAEALLDEITDKLYAMVDPDTGQKVVKKVYRRDELYSGEFWKDGNSANPMGAAELTLDFYPGYRASWSVTAGGIDLVDVENADGELEASPDVFVKDNMKLWSGDHCGVDIHSVQGIFYSNRVLALPEGQDHYDATHLGPTVLDLMGIKVPADYDSPPLVVR